MVSSPILSLLCINFTFPYITKVKKTLCTHKYKEFSDPTTEKKKKKKKKVKKKKKKFHLKFKK